MLKLKLSLYINGAFCLLLLLLLYLHWQLESACEVPDVRKVELEENANEMLCNYGSEPIVGTVDTTIYKLRYSYMNTTEFDCCYRQTQLSNSEPRKTCYKFENPTRIYYEHIAVECYYKNQLIYRDYFTFLPNSVIPENRSLFKVSDVRPLNVIVLILGGVSRNRLHTALPETLKYLRHTHQPLEYEYLQPQTENSDENLKKLLINDEDGIWEVYKRAGFLTATAQDPYKILNVQPFDYNWNIFSFISKHEIGHYNKFVTRCLGTRKLHQDIFDYIQNFMKLKKHRALFGLFYLNHFQNNLVPLLSADKDFLNFFKNMLVHSRDTVIFFLGDKIVEEKHKALPTKSLPFFFLFLPLSFPEEYKIVYRHFKENLKRLVTYEDIFNTLEDFSKLKKFSDFDILLQFVRIKKLWGSNRFSLFQKGRSRTCYSANVDTNACICD